MDNFFSKSKLLSFGQSRGPLLQEEFFKAYNVKLGQASSSQVSVFLSHKHSDLQYLSPIIFLLRKLSIEIYVDWMDRDMPSTTSGETAAIIKDKIKNLDKFILLATQDAIDSKWCNWELGFGDAQKYSKDIAILPVEENDGTWKGSEYLQIYPILTYEGELNIYSNMHVEFKGKKTPLLEWLKS